MLEDGPGREDEDDEEDDEDNDAGPALLQACNEASEEDDRLLRALPDDGDASWRQPVFVYAPLPASQKKRREASP